MVKHNLSWIAAASALVLSLFSCGNSNVVFKEEVNFENSQWAMENTISTEWDISDTDGLYRWGIIVNHSDQFKYQNLYLKVKSHIPGNKSREKEISLQLSNPKTGLWIGEGSASEIILKSLIQDSVRFEQPGQYRFEIEQFSRDSSLQGINAVSVVMEKISEKNKG